MQEDKVPGCNAWLVDSFENWVITQGFISRKMLKNAHLTWYKISVDAQTT